MSLIRILHCPDIVGGNPQNLARAERELGLESWAVAFRQTIFSYPFDEILLKPRDGQVAYIFAALLLFLRGLFNYDFIHYNFGRTIFPTFSLTKNIKMDIPWLKENIFIDLLRMFDLPIFHMMGKGIAVTFQGDDARQGDFSLQEFDISIAQVVESGYYSPGMDSEKRKIIQKFDRYADLIYYLNPDLGNVLPERAKFMPYAHVDLRDWIVPPRIGTERLLVIHAPSHRGAKGTEVILQTVKPLRTNGLDFDFKIVEGLSNHDARKIYEQADLLIDQLYAGWYGGLALELMALGKPVISYIRESDLLFIPEEMRQELPIITATAETLYTVLKHWLNDRNELLKIGTRSRKYVENWHDPLIIAAQMKKDYVETLSKKSFHTTVQRIRSMWQSQG